MVAPWKSLFAVLLSQPVIGLNIVIAGGTGRLGTLLIQELLQRQPLDSFNPSDNRDGSRSSTTGSTTGSTSGTCKEPASTLPEALCCLTILTRNSYLASTPSRVSEDYGHLGKGFIESYKQTKKLRLRDWDGGDLLDIVGQDWTGWQHDVLPQADMILHLTGGGFTEQRVMACERLVRESLKHCPMAYHVTINPSEELLAAMSPGLKSVKTSRIERCEAIVKENCTNFSCLRIGQRDLNVACRRILDTLDDIVAMIHKESFLLH